MDERAVTSVEAEEKGTGGGSGGTVQDLQRAALHDLVALAAQCAAREAEIERRFAVESAANEEARRKATEDIEHRRRELGEEFERKYSELLDRIRTQYEADLRKLETNSRAARQEIEREHATAEAGVKKKLAQAAWLAETVFESAQNQFRAEAKRSKEGYSGRRKVLNELEERAAGLMLAYGQAWPAGGEEATPGPAGGEEAASAPAGGETAAQAEQGVQPEDGSTFEAIGEEAQRWLDEMESLRLPRLMSGIWPFAAVLLAAAAAAGLAQLASGAGEPRFRLMGLAAGLTAAAGTIVGVLVRRSAVRQVWESAARLRRVLEEAGDLARREYEAASRGREVRRAEAAAKREREVREAKEKYAPMLRRSGQAREEALRTQEEERARLLERIEAQRESSLAEVEQWRGHRGAEIEQGYENERRAVRERHERRVEEVHRRQEEERAALQRRWEEGLARIQGPMEEGSAAGAERLAAWESASWNEWRPPRRFSSTIRFGELRVDLKQIAREVPRGLALPERFSVPALLAFPSQASLLIHADQTGRAEAIRVLQTVMVRLLTSLPAGRVRFTIIDPVGLGQNFAGFMHLADHDEALVGSRIWTSDEHIEQRLSDLTEHMETVIQKYLRNEFGTIDDYNAQAGELAEPYRFLVIADFPTHFSDTAVQRLSAIATTGARCGVYTLVARDTRQALPSGSRLDELEAHSVNLVQRDGRFAWKDRVFEQFPLALDGPPSEDFLTRLLHAVGRCAKDAKRVEVPFGTIVPPAEKLWGGDTSIDLSVPIGKMGATRLQTLRLGRGVAQHGLIAGKTGSGKSTLLHVLVTNLSLWYGPDEVEFYLVDFKKGVEFKAYATRALPHARAIAVESDREFGLSVLQRVDAELARRGELFRKLGVQDLASYRQAAGRKLPRTLLMIDEFQEFFSEDDKLAQDAGLLLDRLVRQGRAFGIHVLLGSQTIGGTSGLARSTIGQMAVRVALQTSEADSQIILGDGNSAARLLSRPGEAVYNDAGGLVEANSPFQVAWLPDEERDGWLERVGERARAAGGAWPAPVVFEGNVPADPAKNPLLGRLLERPDWPTATTAPRVWLGEPVAIKEPTCVVLRRQSGSNVLVVGQYDEPALALLSSAMISLAAQHRPEAASFVVFDGTPADSPLAGGFEKLRGVLPHAVRLVDYRGAGEAMGELAEELRRRQAEDAPPGPSVYVFIYGLQRYRALRRQEESFGFSMGGDQDKPAPDRQFADLLREGPAVGLHAICWCDAPAAVERALDRTSLREFDHRVLFQMSATDSSNLIDSPLANKLGFNRALASSEEQGVIEKFRPYALPSGDWLARVRGWFNQRQ